MTFDIGSGAVVAVDTESLRAAAGLADDVAARFELAARRAWAAGRALRPPADPQVADALGGRAHASAAAAHDLAAALRRAADLYQAVDAQAAALVGATTASRAASAARLAAIEARSPGVAAEARRLRDEWWAARHRELVRNASLGLPVVPTPADPAPLGLLGMLAARGLLGEVDRMGRGVAAGGRLSGVADPVEVVRHGERPAHAPGSLRDVASRIPTDAHVRVERYAFLDRPAEYVVYVSGTRDMGALGDHAPLGLARGAGDEAFDMESNLDLYAGHAAESYEGVREALRAAGATPGSVVHAAGHSQGAAIAGRLALEDEYDVRTLVTFGAPVQAVAGERTANVTLRHRDDPIATGLSSGGAPGRAGGPGSVVVQDTHRATPRPLDVGLDAHGMAAYGRLAERTDRSRDPRLDIVRERLGALGGASSVVATEYSVWRVSDASSSEAAGSRRTRR